MSEPKVNRWTGAEIRAVLKGRVWRHRGRNAVADGFVNGGPGGT